MDACRHNALLRCFEVFSRQNIKQFAIFANNASNDFFMVFTAKPIICWRFSEFFLSVLPTNGPQISGERTHYLVGDEIDLNCTSGKSYPASELRWLINDREVISSTADL